MALILRKVFGSFAVNSNLTFVILMAVETWFFVGTFTSVRQRRSGMCFSPYSHFLVGCGPTGYLKITGFYEALTQVTFSIKVTMRRCLCAEGILN